MRIEVPTTYYQHFGADYSLEVPGEGFGGWKKAMLPLDLEHTALCVMHCWATPDPKLRGIYSAVEYIPRAEKIMRERIPVVLQTFRNASVNIIHVESGDYVNKYDAYKETMDLVRPQVDALRKDELPRAKADEVYYELHNFRSNKVHPGTENFDDIRESWKVRDIDEAVKPLPGEFMITESNELQAVCNMLGVNHLIYIGFAINCCILMSPAGMMEMSPRGFLCSIIKEVTTAVENGFSARTEFGKQIGLWHTALFYGFVYEQDDILNAIKIENKDA